MAGLRPPRTATAGSTDLAPSGVAGANAAQPGFVELEQVHLGYLGSFMPNGDPMVDMDATPGDIQLSQVVHGITAGETYQLEFWTAQTFPPGTGELEVFWGGQLIDTITPNSATPSPHLLTVIGGAGDGTNTLTVRRGRHRRQLRHPIWATSRWRPAHPSASSTRAGSPRHSSATIRGRRPPRPARSPAW